jgi:hypothetical protein
MNKKNKTMKHYNKFIQLTQIDLRDDTKSTIMINTNHIVAIVPSSLSNSSDLASECNDIILTPSHNSTNTFSVQMNIDSLYKKLFWNKEKTNSYE